jgi:hypothetical protein
LKLHVNKQSRGHQEWTILGTRHRTRDIKNKQYWAQDTEQGTSRMDNTGHKTQNEDKQNEKKTTQKTKKMSTKKAGVNPDVRSCFSYKTPVKLLV